MNDSGEDGEARAGRWDGDEASGEKLQKVLARAGIASRRRCEELIAGGHVTVNGEPARVGMRVERSRDDIRIDGRRIPVDPRLVYFLVNKPKAVVTTADDEVGRRTVVDLVPSPVRIFPVGRLDADSEGLLILTNDGNLAQELTHPSYELEKEYLVEVQRVPNGHALSQLRQGIMLEDGMTAPARVGRLGERVLSITVHEGRNRLVRRMCDAVGCPVIRLVRVRIGLLSDSRLAPGAFRELRPEEVRALISEAEGWGKGVRRIRGGTSRGTASRHSDWGT